MPTFSSTRRCLVMAWRVRRDPRERAAMEQGSPALSRATSARRVASPSAAKTGAWDVLCLRGDMALDMVHLLRPAALVHAKGLGAARGGDLVEAGFRDGQQRAAGGLLETEFHERGGLGRVIHEGIDVIRVPGIGKEPFRLYFLNGDLPLQVFIAGISDLAAGDPAA